MITNSFNPEMGNLFCNNCKEFCEIVEKDIKEMKENYLENLLNVNKSEINKIEGISEKFKKILENDSMDLNEKRNDLAKYINNIVSGK